MDESETVLDPFCGSGALLSACAAPGRRVIGVDINPVAVLLSRVKVHSFNPQVLRDSVHNLVSLAKVEDKHRAIDWENKDYWFTPAVVGKFERLRYAAKELEEKIPWREWSALLLCLAMAVRSCSRADQRSPKPFISLIARSERKGRHYCPYRALCQRLEDLIAAHSEWEGKGGNAEIILGDVRQEELLNDIYVDCVVTSPPYLNAQDYFRNSKLELYVLEGLMPYRIADLKNRFVGSERGALESELRADNWNFVREFIDEFEVLENQHRRLAAVVVKYFRDMSVVFDGVGRCLREGGRLVIICGDNLVGGVRIETCFLLGQILERRGFSRVETYADRIRDRTLAPKRKGHKGLIKEEIVSCYLKL